MLSGSPVERDAIAVILGKVADKTVRDHIGGMTQEAPLTARIGQTLETALNNERVLGYRIRVVTQDIPDRGRGALEKQLGADLYIGIEVIEGKHRQSKGLLIQSKLREKLNSTQRDALRGACKDMLNSSNASYVWIYAENGIRVFEASEVAGLHYRTFDDLTARRTTTLFKRTLECSEGDVSLGLPYVPSSQMRSALEVMLKERRIRHGVAVTIQPEP